jgi:hypothetical protein
MMAKKGEAEEDYCHGSSIRDLILLVTIYNLLGIMLN